MVRRRRLAREIAWTAPYVALAIRLHAMAVIAQALTIGRYVAGTVLDVKRDAMVDLGCFPDPALCLTVDAEGILA
jgi:hypothetical protein